MKIKNWNDELKLKENFIPIVENNKYLGILIDN